MEDRGLFFDPYLKDKGNSWEKTPKVRWSALQFGDREAIDDIELEGFPSPTTEYRHFFLDNSKQLSTATPSIYHQIEYDFEDRTSIAEFNYTFDKSARLIGLPKAILHMSCEDRDDFVVFVILRKKDRNGKNLMHLNFPFHATPVKSIDDIPSNEQASLNLHLGSVGILQASHREIDSSKRFTPNFLSILTVVRKSFLQAQLQSLRSASGRWVWTLIKEKPSAFRHVSAPRLGSMNLLLMSQG